MPSFEWRVVVEVNMQGGSWESEWEPYTGDAVTAEAATDDLMGAPVGDSLAMEAAFAESGFGYGVQIRETNEEG